MPSNLKKLPKELRQPIEQKTARSEVYNDFFLNTPERVAARKKEASDEYRRRWELLCEHYGADPTAEWPPSTLTVGLLSDFVPGVQLKQASRPRWQLFHDLALWFHSEHTVAQGKKREAGYEELVAQENLSELLPHSGVTIPTVRQRRQNLANLPKKPSKPLTASKAFIEDFDAACKTYGLDPVEIGYKMFVVNSPLLGITIQDEDGNQEIWPSLLKLERERETTG